jgi:hypothetical protein
MIGAVRHGINNQALIKSGKLAIASDGQRQQIAVGDLSGVQQPNGVNPILIQKIDVGRPENMTRESAQVAQVGDNAGGSATGVGIAGVAQDPRDCGLGKRTARKGVLTVFREPGVRPIVMDVVGVQERDEDVDVQ